MLEQEYFIEIKDTIWPVRNYEISHPLTYIGYLQCKQGQ